VGHTRFTPITNFRRMRYARELCQRIDKLRAAG
jgi:hypothetical protein